MYQQLGSVEKKNITPFEKDKIEKKYKDFKKQKYAQYVKELNLPLELDREAIKREAKNLRFKVNQRNQNITRDVSSNNLAKS